MDWEQKAFLEKNNRQLLLENSPSLVGKKTTVESDELLKRFGIVFPFKRTSTPLLIKNVASDFIVEEIDLEGKLHTISKEEDSLSDDLDGKTIYATLVKEGVNTLDAISEISTQLNIDQSNITYSGLKDKEAITAQKIAIRGVSKESVLKIKSENFFLKNIYQDKGVLNPGSLTGNTFTIKLRGSISNEEFSSITSNIKQLESDGFYNFFYLQRFGVPRLCNFIWAIDILSGKYEKAFNDYLTRQTEGEFKFISNIRKNIKPILGDWNNVLYYLNMFPLTFQTEIKMVEHLLNNEEDYKGSFLQVRDQVQLWIYGLASLFFNTTISEYANNESKDLPEKLPTFLSDREEDIAIYLKLLKSIGISQLPHKTLKEFNISLQHRDIDTKSPVIIEYIKKEDFGIEIKFTLSKGSYATTFLSHLFVIQTEANPIK